MCFCLLMDVFLSLTVLHDTCYSECYLYNAGRRSSLNGKFAKYVNAWVDYNLLLYTFLSILFFTIWKIIFFMLGHFFNTIYECIVYVICVNYILAIYHILKSIAYFLNIYLILYTSNNHYIQQVFNWYYILCSILYFFLPLYIFNILQEQSVISLN